MNDHEDPEDILSTSLETLYDYQPITLSSTNSLFTFTIPSTGSTITLRTPDTEAANWSLHASAVWAASRFLAQHISYLDLPSDPQKRLKLLELGASAGLPSIVIAKCYPHVSVVATDYPDDKLIAALAENVASNSASVNCKALSYGWGSDPVAAQLFEPDGEKFDFVVAADTLWNPDFHKIFVDSLSATLKRTLDARIHLFAGLHTGRYTIKSFLIGALAAGFTLHRSLEAEVAGKSTRPWTVERDGEEESDRRRWVVYFVLGWSNESIW
ncbi:hypothetical protein MKEN_01090800 [Mycena kentingensis (nom. inval.)]|nr:hypothetical protein MKEN_01090800 [Mycena kentingensis (nom. inval.)]